MEFKVSRENNERYLTMDPNGEIFKVIPERRSLKDIVSQTVSAIFALIDTNAQEAVRGHDCHFQEC